MCGVYYDHVHMSAYQSVYPLHHVSRDADTCAAQKAPLLVLGGEWIFDLLFNVLDGDKSLQVEVVIHNGQLLFSCLAQNFLGFLQRDAFLGGDQSFGGHGFLDLF